MSTTNEKTFKKKENELLHDTLGFMATKLKNVKNSFHKVKDCTAHA